MPLASGLTRTPEDGELELELLFPELFPGELPAGALLPEEDELELEPELELDPFVPGADTGPVD